MLTGIKNLDFKILNDLDDRSLVNYCETHKEAYQTCNDQTFWMNRILLKFPYLTPQMLRKYKGDRTWSEYYIGDLRTINPNNSKMMMLRAILKGRLDLVIVAVKNGATIQPRDGEAIRTASEEGHLDIVKYLVSQGVDIKNNDYALIWASKGGHLELVQYLISQGANIGAFGDLALKMAVIFGHLEVVKYLISQGANVKAGYDALRLGEHRNVVDYLNSL